MKKSTSCHLNDLKMLQRSGHLRTALYGGVDHVHRQARFLSSDGAYSAPCVSSWRRSLQRRLQGQGIYLSRPLPLHGLLSVDLPRNPQGYRSLPARPEKQALSHGDSQYRFPQYTGQRKILNVRFFPFSVVSPFQPKNHLTL